MSGEAVVRGNGVRLTPDEVVEVDKSRGAAWADPLAALGEGVILKSIERAANTSAPALHRERAGNLRFTVEIRRVDGNDDVVTLGGDLTVKARKPGSKKDPGAEQ